MSNYTRMPNEYIRKLKIDRGLHGRKKARSFMEYFDDMDSGCKNSETFYAKSWGVSSSTSHEWIKEFKAKIKNYFEYWALKNDVRYSKFYTECLPSENDSRESRNDGGLKNVTECLPRQVINKENNNNSAHACVSDYYKDFEELYKRCKSSYKFVGKRADASKEYKRIHPHVKPIDMWIAYSLHVKDPLCQGKIFNLANYMHNDMYVSYLSSRIKVTTKDGKILEGWYDKEVDLLTTNNEKYELTKDRFYELLCKGDIEFLPQLQSSKTYQ